MNIQAYIWNLTPDGQVRTRWNFSQWNPSYILHAHWLTQTYYKSHRGYLLQHHRVGGVKLLLEVLIPTCLKFPPHLFSVTLEKRPLCFPGMTTAWRVLLLWVCVCIWLPAQAGGALVISSRNVLTQVFNKNYLWSSRMQTNVSFVIFHVSWCLVESIHFSFKSTSFPWRILRHAGCDEICVAEVAFF